MNLSGLQNATLHEFSVIDKGCNRFHMQFNCCGHRKRSHACQNLLHQPQLAPMLLMMCFSSLSAVTRGEARGTCRTRQQRHQKRLAGETGSPESRGLMPNWQHRHLEFSRLCVMVGQHRNLVLVLLKPVLARRDVTDLFPGRSRRAVRGVPRMIVKLSCNIKACSRTSKLAPDKGDC